MRAGVVRGRIIWTAGGVAGLRQRSRQILDPAARALSFLVRRPSDVVEVDRRESLDRLVHVVGEGSRDVLEAAAIWLAIGHGTILAAPPRCSASTTRRGVSAGAESTSPRAGARRRAARRAHRLPGVEQRDSRSAAELRAEGRMRLDGRSTPAGRSVT